MKFKLLSLYWSSRQLKFQMPLQSDSKNKLPYLFQKNNNYVFHVLKHTQRSTNKCCVKETMMLGKKIGL